MWLTPLEQLDLLSDYQTDHHNRNPLLLVLSCHELSHGFTVLLLHTTKNMILVCRIYLGNEIIVRSFLGFRVICCCTSVSQGFEDFLDILPGRMQEQGSSLYFIVGRIPLNYYYPRISRNFLTTFAIAFQHLKDRHVDRTILCLTDHLFWLKLP